MKKQKPSTTRIQIEFSPTEVEAWKNFTKVMKPPDVTMDDFCKQVFLLGAQFLNDTLTRMAEEARVASVSGSPEVVQPDVIKPLIET